ncbi:MAG: cytochrome c biogenesis protein ResB [Verrucomicrobiaceae bacterium]
MSSSKPPRTLGQKVFRVLAGFEIAVVCFALLTLLTFFGTIEQTWIGLHGAIEKYFDYEAFLVIPRNAYDKIIFLPLPGAYWVIVVLSVNMFLGGIVRMRKGWRTAGVLVSHFAILFMLVAGAVSSLYKEEGSMGVTEGEKSDYASSYNQATIEIAAYDENGDRGAPVVVPSEPLESMRSTDVLNVELPDLPFDLKVTGMLQASEMRMAGSVGEGSGKVIDGFVLQEVEKNTTDEVLNFEGCYVTVRKDGEDLQELLLWSGNPFPVTVTVEGVRYGILMTRKIWPMPFEVELHKSVGEYYPGTRKARWFQSDVTKVTGEERTDYEIIMNHPMRHGGYTLFQAQWEKPEGKARSGFAVVKNPSDKWPEWALYVAGIALLVHFSVMLVTYTYRSMNKTSSKAS